MAGPADTELKTAVAVFVTSLVNADVSNSRPDVVRRLEAAAPVAMVVVVSDNAGEVTEGTVANVDEAAADGDGGGALESVRICVGTDSDGAVNVPEKVKPGMKDGT